MASFDEAKFEIGHCDRCGPDAGRTLVAERPLGDRTPSPGTYAFWCCNLCGVKFYSPRYQEDVWLGLMDNHAQETQARLLETTGAWSNVPVPHPETQIQSLVRTYARMWEQTESLAQRPIHRVLDVGCHVGHSLTAATARGWAAHGVEPNRHAAAYAAAKGRGCEVATVRRCGYVDGLFDLALWNDACEHSFTPWQDMERIHRLLAPGGALAVKTFADDLPMTARPEGVAWYQALGHEWHWTVEGLHSWLDAAGFEVVDSEISEAYAQVLYLCRRA